MTGIISDLAAFEQLCGELGGHSQLGVDTEFMRERTYFPQLCLLQLSFGSQAVCIDPVALPQLGALGSLLREASVRKIVHAARQDLEVLSPLAGPLAGLFDTQVAAALAGLPAQIGYAELVTRLLGRTLTKSQTRTDWSRRPLSEAQLQYALDDVRYLPPLAEELTGRLGRLGRWSWFVEEMSQLEGIGSFQVEPEEAWRRLKGVYELDEPRRQIARTLAAWRERRAIRTDRPRNWILPDAALRDIARDAPRTAAQLAAITELPEGIRRHSGEQILALIDALQLPARLPPLPPARRPAPEQLEAVRRLADVTRAIGRELGLAPEILATRREMERLVAGDREAAPLSGWRRAVIGERLLGVL